MTGEADWAKSTLESAISEIINGGRDDHQGWRGVAKKKLGEQK